MIKKVFMVIGSVLLLIVITVSLGLFGLEWKRFFSPRSQDINREVFKKTRSYNEGKIQDLARYRLQYLKAEPQEKEALKQTIILLYADYELKEMPEKLKEFLREMRGY